MLLTGTNNEFSIPAEYYIRAHFRAIHGDEMNEKFTEFVDFIGVNSMTMCFEFVTTFLGDHGCGLWTTLVGLRH